MFIGKSKAYTNNKRNRRKLAFFSAGLLLSLLLCLVASNLVKTKGYNGLYDFSSTIFSNYLNGLKAEPQPFSIEISSKDYKLLEKNRQKALERGIIINDLDGDYVPATVQYNGEKIAVKLRLKGHMTDHLQDNKWSFRIKIKDDHTFMGMKLFSIQHPGTRGYIYEWIYHELMKREGIIALRYKFINVYVNGKDWGIYAVEENFDKELIENNHRPPGPIVRFNPEMYWVDRFNELKGSQPVAEYASYFSANVEAYREDKWLKDTLQKKYYMNAIASIEAVRANKIQVDNLFDIEKLAKFHAIIDLVGGHHSMDWSDIKFYYNPITEKLEPVAYESFTVLPSRMLAGDYKYVQLDSNANYSDLYTAIFSNKAFFKRYISNLERISQAVYLDQFFNDSNEELKKNLSLLYKEFPYKKFDRQEYYKNQVIIRKSISPPKAFNAYFVKAEQNSLAIQIGAITSLPVEIKSVSIGTAIALPTDPIILPAKQPNQFVNYEAFYFTLPEGMAWSDTLAGNLKINYSILGASLQQECKAYPFKNPDAELIMAEKSKDEQFRKLSFLRIDEKTKAIFIQPGKHVITQDIRIPENYRVMANSEVALDFRKKAKLISYSPLIFIGSDESPVCIESGDSSSTGILVIKSEKSIFNNVQFKKLGTEDAGQLKGTGALTFYESPFELKDCRFYNCKAKNIVSGTRARFSIQQCLFSGAPKDVLELEASEGSIFTSAFENCKQNAVNAENSKLFCSALQFSNIGSKAINLKGRSEFKGNTVQVHYTGTAISVEDIAIGDFSNLTVNNTELCFKTKSRSDAANPVLKIRGLILSNVQKKYVSEGNAVITVDGKSWEGEAIK